MNAGAGLELFPGGKHHHVFKHALVVMLFAFASIALPGAARAGLPSVQPPTGPKNANGSFSGAYSFATYVYCDSGVTLSGSYANNLDGTHSFNFVGAPDGSLLVRLDGGGAQLVSSCGAPFATPQTPVASYTVSKNTAAPTPNPTPVPTPNPTPVPTQAPSSGGSSSGGSTGSSGGSASHSGGTATPSGGTKTNGAKVAAVTPAAGNSATAAPAATITPEPTASADPSSGGNAGGSTSGGSGSGASDSSGSGAKTTTGFETGTNGPGLLDDAGSRAMAIVFVGIILLLVVGGGFIAWRNTTLRHDLASLWLSAKIRLEPLAFRLRLWLRTHTHGHDLRRGRFVSGHEHTGKALAHHHTSYPALLLVIGLAAGVTGLYSESVSAESAELSLTVNGPAPTFQPTITEPIGGSVAASAVISVRGACEPGTVVRLTRSGAFAGSIACASTGDYALILTLADGDNELVARDYDGANQASPASLPVTVRYDAPPAPTPTATPIAPVTGGTPSPTPVAAGRPSTGSGGANGSTGTGSIPGRTATPPRTSSTAIVIISDQPAYQGVPAGEALLVLAKLEGGKGPFTVDWNWGDGSQQSTFVVTRDVQASHAYAVPGMYRLVIRTIDASGRQAALTLSVIVTGAVSSTAAASADAGSTRPDTPSIIIAWPVIAMMLVAVVSFWLGERHIIALRRRDERFAVSSI